MGLLGILAICACIGWLSAWLCAKYARICKLLNQIQGPSALPLIGNLHQFRLNPDGLKIWQSINLLTKSLNLPTNISPKMKIACKKFFEQAQGVAYMFREQRNRMVRIWMGPLPFAIVYGAEECEPILSSNKTLTKLYQYSFLSPWIGEGLLISKPEKWRPRRKLLTPTFHYDILKDFVPVFNRHGRTLVEQLDKLVGRTEFTDIFHTITRCTLDIICESALGVNIDVQRKETDYLDAVMKIKYIMHQRIIRPQFFPEFVFNFFGEGKEQQRCVQILHEFTNKAILKRKKAMEEAGGIEQLMAKKAAEGGNGSRLALLDLMLEMHNRGELDIAGIQEEVDTFTFEGHDTTSTALNWFLHLMGSNPDIQSHVQQEIDHMLGPDEERELCYDELGQLPYLDACLKETLRLYPSVPLIARQLTEDLKIKDFVLPSGTGVVITPSMVHRDPQYWENPEVFDPERFLKGDYLKHPYCYIPFSAGARNCIGQRFALMEEKCLIAKVLRHFRITSKWRTDQMRVAAELIIRPMYGNMVKLERRSIGKQCI